MRWLDEASGEVRVERDPGGELVALRIEGATTAEAAAPATAMDGGRVIRLTGEEARRLAALILFQAARLDRPRAFRAPVVVPLRQSA